MERDLDPAAMTASVHNNPAVIDTGDAGMAEPAAFRFVNSSARTANLPVTAIVTFVATLADMQFNPAMTATITDTSADVVSVGGRGCGTGKAGSKG
jgi:hypothetical protein